MSDSPLTPGRNGFCVAVRLTPRAKADRVHAVAATADGKWLVKASVTAPPEAGRANEALLVLPAGAWRVPRRDLTIVAGLAGRQKIVSVAGDPQQLAGKLGALIAALPSR